MREPFIFLYSEITRENALVLMHWLEDHEVGRYLSDARNVSASIAQVLDRVNLPILTHLFNKDGRFYIAYDRHNVPVGFVRLVIKSAETEIVIVIGDRNNWGKHLGTGTIRESLKIAFFELRSPRVVANIHKENRRSIRAFRNAGFRMEHETSELKSFIITMEEYLKSIQEEIAASDEIYITEVDKARLKKLIDDKLYDGMKMDKSLLTLDREINRATVVDIKQLRQDVVTMNSRFLLHLNGEEMEASLVYPHEADWTEKRLSVLSPIGTAILGYSEGNSIEWEVPSGVIAIEIKKILYQPEAAGDYQL
ncbi:MAG: nucleoside diphosphate kinase regulator [Clostridiaceae bacterium]